MMIKYDENILTRDISKIKRYQNMKNIGTQRISNTDRKNINRNEEKTLKPCERNEKESNCKKRNIK